MGHTDSLLTRGGSVIPLRNSTRRCASKRNETCVLLHHMSKIGSIGIDVGGTKTRFALFDEKFKLVEQVKIRTRDHKDAKEFTAAIDESLDALLKKCEKADLRVESVGVGCAGYLNGDGSVKHSPNIPFLKGYTFRPVIAKQTGANVFATNDVAAALYGEHQLGAAVGRKHVIAIFIGTGIGGALMFGGQLYRGATGGAGDIGHYVLHPIDALSGDKHRDVLDDIASRTAIAAEAVKLAARNRAPYLLKTVGSDIANVTSGALAKAIEHGDDEIEKLLRNRCHTLGIALSNIVDFLNPEMIVLGGGLTEELPDLVRDEVEAGVRANSKPESKKKLEVVVAKLKDHSVTTGAAKLAFDVSLTL
jgi:glucokinase